MNKRIEHVVLKVFLVLGLILQHLMGASVAFATENQLIDRTPVEGVHEIPVQMWHATNETLSGFAGNLVSSVITVNGSDVQLSIQFNDARLIAFRYFEENFAGEPIEMSTPGFNADLGLITFTMPLEVGMDWVYVGMSVNTGTPAGVLNQRARLSIDWTDVPLIENEPVPNPIVVDDGEYLISGRIYHATNPVPSPQADQHLLRTVVTVEGGRATLRLEMGSSLISVMRFSGPEGQWIPMTASGFNSETGIGTFTMPLEIGATEIPINFSITGAPISPNARIILDWNDLVPLDLGQENENNDEDQPNTYEPEDEERENGEDEEVDRYNLADGTYTIQVALWHATDHTYSAAAAILQDVANIVVIDGVYTLMIHTDQVEMFGLTSWLETLVVLDENRNPVPVTTLDNGLGTGNSFAFEMPHLEQFIAVTVAFPWTADHQMMVQPARLNLNWETLTFISSDTDVDLGGETTVGGEDEEDDSDLTDETDSILDIHNLPNGIFEVDIALWHATLNQPSIANDAFNTTARILVEDGVYTMFVYTRPLTFGAVTASLQSMQVETASGGFSYATIEARVNHNPTVFSFEMPHENEFIAVEVNPMVSIVGYQYIDARLRVNWGTIRQVESEIDLLEPPMFTTPATRPPSTPAVPTGDDANLLLYVGILATALTVIVGYVGYHYQVLKIKKLYMKKVVD